MGEESWPTVELHAAFLWTCPECGLDQFERTITVEPESIDVEDLPIEDPEHREAVREWISHGGEGDFIRAPDEVECSNCGATFGTEEY